MNVTPETPEERTLPESEALPSQITGETQKKEIRIFAAPNAARPPTADELLMSQMGGPKSYQVGDRVNGKVVQVKEDGLIVNIGTKNEGIVPREELSFVPNPSTEMYKPGQELDMIVIRQGDDDTYFLSKKRAEADKVWKTIGEAYASGARLNAVGSQVVNAGIILDVGVRAFMPLSHADIKRIAVEDLIGQQFEVKVLEFDKESRPQRLVVSRRLCIEEDLTKERDDLYNKFQVGDVVKGKVEKLTNFGAFVNLGGITGLLHISQMARKRITDPSEAVTAGEEIDVKIIDIDREKQKIRLSLRDLLADPWEEADRSYKAGDIVEGSVVRVTSFGAFIKIDNYFEGLAHISELVDNKISHAKEVLSPGDQVTVMILEIDKKRKRIRLSVKKAVEREARREVNAFMKQQDDMRNTLKFPADAFINMGSEDYTEAPVEAGAPVVTHQPGSVIEPASAVTSDVTSEASAFDPGTLLEEASGIEADEFPGISETAVEEAASPSTQHSVDDSKDLLSGDELDDNGPSKIASNQNHRRESTEIDLVEGNELEEN